VVQLAEAVSLQRKRQEVADCYFNTLGDLPLDLPAPPLNGSLHSWHIFPVRIHEDAPATRDDVIVALTQARIGTSVHYRPLHEMTYWKKRYPSRQGDFPEADRYFAGAVTLPLFPGMTDWEVGRVASVLREVLG
jgi:dTDP-4-amino-4,6-dideoxygalactose transaminase